MQVNTQSNLILVLSKVITLSLIYLSKHIIINDELILFGQLIFAVAAWCCCTVVDCLS